jgi:hypothetical protein
LGSSPVYRHITIVDLHATDQSMVVSSTPLPPKHQNRTSPVGTCSTESRVYFCTFPVRAAYCISRGSVLLCSSSPPQQLFAAEGGSRWRTKPNPEDCAAESGATANGCLFLKHYFQAA